MNSLQARKIHDVRLALKAQSPQIYDTEILIEHKLETVGAVVPKTKFVTWM